VIYRVSGLAEVTAAFFAVFLSFSATAWAGKPLISEVRVGVLNHDVGIFGSSKENGVDINAEILFRRLGNKSAAERKKFIPWFLSPRPHLGTSVNSQGDTSIFYAGLTWDVDLGQKFFFNTSFGGAVHDGEKTSLRPDKKELGCRVLFRGSASLGYNLTRHVNISAMFEHASNAGLCNNNEGLNNAGVRLGYRF